MYSTRCLNLTGKFNFWGLPEVLSAATIHRVQVIVECNFHLFLFGQNKVSCGPETQLPLIYVWQDLFGCVDCKSANSWQWVGVGGGGEGILRQCRLFQNCYKQYITLVSLICKSAILPQTSSIVGELIASQRCRSFICCSSKINTKHQAHTKSRLKNIPTTLFRHMWSFADFSDLLWHSNQCKVWFYGDSWLWLLLSLLWTTIQSVKPIVGGSFYFLIARVCWESHMMANGAENWVTNLHSDN